MAETTAETPASTEVGAEAAASATAAAIENTEITVRDLLEAGVHFGHQTRRWNPRMGSFLFGERNGIHIIDLDQTLPLFKSAVEFVKETVASGGKVLFVSTKRQAQAVVQIEAARSLVYSVAKFVDSNSRDISKESAMAKLFATDMAMNVTIDAVQVMGGSGYMREYPVEKMMRDAKILQIYEGTNQIQRNVIGQALVKETAKKK